MGPGRQTITADESTLMTYDATQSPVIPHQALVRISSNVSAGIQNRGKGTRPSLPGFFLVLYGMAIRHCVVNHDRSIASIFQ